MKTKLGYDVGNIHVKTSVSNVLAWEFNFIRPTGRRK